jgi:hypothetical protein
MMHHEHQLSGHSVRLSTSHRANVHSSTEPAKMGNSTVRRNAEALVEGLYAELSDCFS